MQTPKILPIRLFALGLIALCGGTSVRAFDHTHAEFTEVLRVHVKGATCDYASLKKSPQKLDSYLTSLSSVKESEFQGWTESRQIAFLVNLYNAATLKLVIDQYPVKSIKDIGGILSSPWKQPVVGLFGGNVTLDHVEHGLLRKNYDEPRVHFAVNCASVGCPNLRAEAFQADKLDAQLDEQTRLFLSDKTRNRVDGGTLYLSPIFDWFAVDFTKAGTLSEFVAPYFPADDRKAIASGGLKTRFTDYNWSLNQP
jgi:hypothetical protein